MLEACETRLVVVSMNFSERTVLVPPLASHSELTEAILMEGATVLSLEEVVSFELLFCQLVDSVKFIIAVRVLTLTSIIAEPLLLPVLTDVALVLLVHTDLCLQVAS